MKIWSKSQMKFVSAEPGTYYLMTTDPDLQGIQIVLAALQERAAAATEIMFTYGELVNAVNGIRPQAV